MFKVLERVSGAEERFEHQMGRCALCGKEIVWENYCKGDRGAWQLHHIDGNPENDNINNLACVCINEPQNCHLYVAHNGDTKKGALALHKWFRLEGWDEENLGDILQYKKPEEIVVWHIAND